MKKISTAHKLLFATTGIGVLIQLLMLNVANYNILIMTFQMVISIPTLVYLFVTKQDISEVLRIKAISVPTVLFSILAAILCYPIAALISVISSYFIEGGLTDTMSMVYDAGLGFTLFAVAVLPALGEEILFRGVLYNTYSKVSPRKGILLSAALFALMHMNFYQMFYAFFVGFVFALMMEAADSLLVPMLMHFVFNAVSVVNGYYVYSSSNVAAQAEMIVNEDLAMKAALFNYTVTALVCAGILIVVIYVTYSINKRQMKLIFIKKPDVVTKDHLTDEPYPKAKWIDLWLILFLLYAAVAIAYNTYLLIS